MPVRRRPRRLSAKTLRTSSSASSRRAPRPALPISPFMLFDYYLLHTVPKDTVREAFNNLIVRCDQMWVFGNLSLGVKVQIGIAKRLRKPLRFYDITDMPYRVVSVPEAMLREE